MSRRHVLIGIVVVMLGALLASGVTLAAGSPFAGGARKHHKKKHRKKHKKQQGGGTPSGCSGNATSLNDRGWGLRIKCASGTVTAFQVATNHAIDTNPPAGAGSFTCSLTSSTSFSCTGASVPSSSSINAHWAAVGADVLNSQCKVNPGETVTVTVAGKSFNAPVSGC